MEQYKISRSMVEAALRKGVCYFDSRATNLSRVFVLQLMSGAWFGVVQDPSTRKIKTVLYDKKWSGVVKGRFQPRGFPCRW